MNPKALLAALVLSWTAVGGAWAHDSFSLTGAIVEVSANKLVVKCDDGSVQTVRLDYGIPIYDGQKIVVPATLKVGQKVTLDAFGDRSTDVEIQGVHLAAAHSSEVQN